MQAVLVMLSSNSSPRLFEMQKDTIVIGRREDADLRVPLPDISRAHAKVVKDEANNSLRVEDLGSSNGTFVNGNRIQVQALAAGDIVSVGPVKLGVQIDGAPGVEELAGKANATHRNLTGGAGKPQSASKPKPKAAAGPSKPKSLEDEIDAILSGDSDEREDSDMDIHIDLNDSKA